uniref:Uncharacterized protein n=1 Tax=Coccidioides posadasii RMSCC 3488 TaxID=454284 RepID=A0A0J6FKX1_COCPO|nr:hypothetical protein CPAG_05809 [Coccidioides posadasii RMSCC 3488]
MDSAYNQLGDILPETFTRELIGQRRGLRKKCCLGRARLISNSSSCLYHFRNRSLKLRHREKTTFSLSDEGPNSPSLSQLHGAVTRGRECDWRRVECYLQGHTCAKQRLETNEVRADEYVPRS